jgi:hypothetical protein
MPVLYDTINFLGNPIKYMMIRTLSLTFLFSSLSLAAYAMPPFIGDDFSGEYLCKGKNDSVGEYEVLVKLKLNNVTSHDIYGVYDFNTETNNQAIYTGQIMAKGRHFAMTFKLLSASTYDFSTGMGEFKKTENNRWSFRNTYYEPDGNGGNFGNDYCVIKQTPKPQEKTSNQAQKLNKGTS